MVTLTVLEYIMPIYALRSGMSQSAVTEYYYAGSFSEDQADSKSFRRGWLLSAYDNLIECEFSSSWRHNTERALSIAAMIAF